MAVLSKLASLKAKGAVIEKAKPKEGMRTIDFTANPSVAQIITLCEVACIIEQLKPLFEQHHKSVQAFFFDLWTRDMWENKKLPDNFKAIIKKMGKDGKPTLLDDLSCNFLLKFRVEGLQKKLPAFSDIPEGKEVQDILIESLIALGIDKDKAHKFAQEEFEVKEGFVVPLDKLSAAPEGSKERIVADYLVECATATSLKERNKLPILTDEQRAVAVVSTYDYLLKKGVEERLLAYVDSLEQLQKLLKFLSVTEQVSHFFFAISDEVADRKKRTTEIANRCLNMD